MAGRFLNHPPPRSVSTQPARRSAALKIVICYAAFSCLWILFSDELLSRIISDKDVLTHWQTFKGWTFIAITALMLYALISRSLAALHGSHAALAESEARFRRVVESNIIGIVFWQANGQVLDANEAYLKIAGYTLEDLLGGKVNWLGLTSPEPRRVDEGGRANGSTIPYEREYVRKDGSHISVLIGTATLDEDAGTRMAFVLDITGHKQVEQALRESERQLREILENIRLLSVMFDREGLIMFGNDCLLELTGRRFEDVVGRDWFETFLPPDQRELIKFTFTEMLKKGMAPAHLEYEIQPRSGDRRIISWSNTVLRNQQGDAIGITGIGEDVTERKLSEERFRAAYEQSRALSTRLQSVREEERIRIAREIHDVLGQALTGLKMDVWWLIKKFSAEGGAPNKQTLLEKFESMSELINSTIGSVRKLATELRPGVLDDLGLVAAIEWQAREFQARTGINCRLRLPEEDLVLRADESTAVFRIFQEILTNVARHADARNVEVAMREEDGILVLEVADDGRGIAENKISGAGSLGILGMRERAVLFGGEVRIRIGKRKGTVVTVRIPLSRGTQPIAELSRTRGAT